MVRLDVGLGRSGWAAWLGCLVPTIVMLNLAVVAISWMFFSASSLPALGWVTLLPLLLADAGLGAKLVSYYRNAFWLDGRTLIRRVITGRKYYDLSAAHLSVESAHPMWAARHQTLPRLIVQIPGCTPVKLWLRDPDHRGTLLPPSQLAALAQAIDPGLQHPIARRFWEIASDPIRGVL